MEDTKALQIPKFKIFDKYDISEIEVKDPGLKSAINLTPKLILKSHGRSVGEGKMGQIKINIVERLMNRLSTAGHRGKKHRIESMDPVMNIAFIILRNSWVILVDVYYNQSHSE